MKKLIRSCSLSIVGCTGRDDFQFIELASKIVVLRTRYAIALLTLIFDIFST